MNNGINENLSLGQRKENDAHPVNASVAHQRLKDQGGGSGWTIGPDSKTEV